jgi:hypothetical protein
MSIMAPSIAHGVNCNKGSRHGGRPHARAFCQLPGIPIAPCVEP